MNTIMNFTGTPSEQDINFINDQKAENYIKNHEKKEKNLTKACFQMKVKKLWICFKNSSALILFSELQQKKH